MGTSKETGRPPSTEVLPGRLALSVGDPGTHASKGWHWIRLAEIAEMATGHTPSRRRPEYWGGDIPWVAVHDARPCDGGYISTTQETINQLGISNSAAVLLPKDTVCLSRTGSIGYAVMLDRPMATSQGFVNWICGPELDPHFLRYLFSAEKASLEEWAEGSAHTTIYFPRAKAFYVCVPSLPEQRRIVAKLDELMAEIKAAKAHLARAKEILKSLRQSILTVSCSGQLTAEWREQQRTERADDDAVQFGAWRTTALRDVCVAFEYGTANKSDDKGDIPVLRMGNLQDGEINWTDLKYSSDRKEIAKYSLSPYTVLFNRTNSPELVGKVAIYRGERPAIFAGYLIRIVHSQELDPLFLNYCLNEQGFRDYCMQVKSDGVSQSNINAKKLASYEIVLPTLVEQREITRRVEALFAMAKRIEGYLQSTTVRAELMQQASLAKAFRGELVPPEAELAAEEGSNYEATSTPLVQNQDASKTRTAYRRRGGMIVVKRRTGTSIPVRRALDEILREQGNPLTPDRLFDLAGFDEESVDVFYEQLRKLIQDGKIYEHRPNNTDVFLEAVGT